MPICLYLLILLSNNNYPLFIEASLAITAAKRTRANEKPNIERECSDMVLIIVQGMLSMYCIFTLNKFMFLTH